MRNTILAFVVALALRVAWFVSVNPQQVGDSVGYTLAASTFSQFGSLSGWLMPAFVVIVSALGSVAPYAMLVLSAGVCFSVYYAGKWITGRQTIGVVAAWIVALHPDFIAYASVIHPRHVYILAMPLFVALAWAGRTIASGFVSVAAGLFRGEALFIVPAIAAAVWRRFGRWHALKIVCIFAIGTIATFYVMPKGSSFAATFMDTHSPGRYGHKTSHDATGHEAIWRGLKYIASHPEETLKNAAIMPARKMWAPAAYGVDASTRTLSYPAACYACNGLSDYSLECSSVPRHDVIGHRYVGSVMAVSYYLTLLMLSAPFFVLSRNRMTILAVIAGNWIAHGLIFYAAAQYRYGPEVLLSIAAAWTICQALPISADGTCEPT